MPRPCGQVYRSRRGRCGPVFFATVNADSSRAVRLKRHRLRSRHVRAPLCCRCCCALLSADAPQTIEEKAQLCSACHGESGIPQEKTTPVIWGQHQGYPYLQLRDYKRGDRKNDQMTPIAEALERDEMMALAEYFAKKPWPESQAAAGAGGGRGAGAARQCRGRLHRLSSGGISGRRHAAASRRPDQGISGPLDARFPHRARGNNPGNDRPDDSPRRKRTSRRSPTTWQGCRPRRDGVLARASFVAHARVDGRSSAVFPCLSFVPGPRRGATGGRRLPRDRLGGDHQSRASAVVGGVDRARRDRAGA